MHGETPFLDVLLREPERVSSYGGYGSIANAGFGQSRSLRPTHALKKARVGLTGVGMTARMVGKLWLSPRPSARRPSPVK